MIYLALGDSISMDDYTGVPAGGAASQFARLIGANCFQNLTRDGCTTEGVLNALDRVTVRPDVVTLTAGGNDFLQNAFQMPGAAFRPAPDFWEKVTGPPFDNLRVIAGRLAEYRCPVLMNTIYDPTDGMDSLAVHLGIPAKFRPAFEALNDGIRALAAQCGFILADLQTLFAGHGMISMQPWITRYIEPNYDGATAIARHWHELYRKYVR
jgi:lysophospholipase L1-like esterase